jgi:exopolysaccharide biosynthesis polyprenyl glycosylphosphotransferase
VNSSPASPPKPKADAKSRQVQQFNPAARSRSRQGETSTAVVVIGDLLMIVAGLLLGFWLRFKSGLIPLKVSWWSSGDTQAVHLRDYAGLIGIGAAFLFITFLYLDLYLRRNLLRFRKVATIVARGALFWLVAYLSLSLVLKFNPPISRVYVACSFFATSATVLLWRALFHRILQIETFAKLLRQRVLFVGWSEEAARLAEVIHSDESQPYQIVGCLPGSDGSFRKPPASLIKVTGNYDNLAELLHSQAVDIVILTDLETPTDEIIALTNLCEREMVQFKVVPSYFQILISGLQLETISRVPILGVAELPLDRLSNRMLKRMVDLAGAVVGLLLALPLMLIFGAIIFYQSPGPVFYRQVRTGRGGRDFQIIKLRSMKLNAEQAGAQWAKKDDDRRLPIGAFLRAWNLDEVPQFWNVLTGEMSLVGPRPERPELIAGFQYDIPHYNARLASKPGITGWAQVNGLRGDTDLTERVRYDLYYLENWSLMLDFQIMFQTFISRKNAY